MWWGRVCCFLPNSWFSAEICSFSLGSYFLDQFYRSVRREKKKGKENYFSPIIIGQYKKSEPGKHYDAISFGQTRSCQKITLFSLHSINQVPKEEREGGE